MTFVWVTIIALAGVCGTARSATAQVGVRFPVTGLGDTAPRWSLFTSPSATNGAVPGRERPFARSTFRLADVAQGKEGAVRCPMPVFVPDSTRQDRMPIMRADTSAVERIPIGKTSCVNPLWSKTRP